jgi:thioredoxin 1
VVIAKMDVDQSRVTPTKFGVRNIPMLMLFKNGVPHAQKVGLVSKVQLAAFLDQNL